jgi:hypothetical protein
LPGRDSRVRVEVPGEADSVLTATLRRACGFASPRCGPGLFLLLLLLLLLLSHLLLPLQLPLLLQLPFQTQLQLA